jgi:hypothetical protein
MFDLAVRYLRDHGWRHWDVLQLETGSGVVWLFFQPDDDSPSVVGKFFADLPAAAEPPRECAILERLSPFAGRLNVPRLLMQARTEHGFIYLQSGIPGTPMADELSPDDDTAIAGQLAMVEPWLDAFHSAVPAHSDVAAALDAQLRKLPELPAPLERSARAALPLLAGVPCVAVHGDFWGHNVLQWRKRVGVIDWGAFHFGAAVEDLFTFCASSVFLLNRPVEESADTMWDVFFGSSPIAAQTHAAANRLLESRGLDATLMQPLFLVFLLTRVAQTQFADNPAFRSFTTRYAAAGAPRPWTGARIR